MLNRKHPLLWLAVATAVSMGTFIFLAAAQSQAGFPLDDAWIHQTYARNLIREGQLSYLPGVSSAGSTAPLWTLLLALGYLLRLPYLMWAYLLGGLSLLWLAWGGMRLQQLVWPDVAWPAWVTGLALIFTWPLVWAAASGMETAFFMALGVQTLVAYYDEKPMWQVGLLGGLLILTRPDGLVLLFLIGMALLLSSGKPIPERVKAGMVFGGTAVLVLLPYFFFNWQVSNTIWPNTLYAKQAEYTVLLATPIWQRLAELLLVSAGGVTTGLGMSSAHLLLLPGIVVAGLQTVRQDWGQRRLWQTLLPLWAGGHVFLYAWRLPVTYQHGRYLLTAVPLWVLLGLVGWYWLGKRATAWQERVGRLGQQVLGLSFLLILLFFWLLGGTAYANDVAFIENEMVATARWLAENTAEDDLIAAHDIGALGYFAERPLLDLAGLISPEVIPYLNDEARLAEHIKGSQAAYLVTAPGWPYLMIIEATSAQQRFNSNYEWTQEQGVNNMHVYQLPINSQ